MLEITLPFPSYKGLKPNSRTHWAVKHQHTKKYRAECGQSAKVQTMPARDIVMEIAAREKIDMDIIFHPPDRRKRDKDNLIAAFKAGQDGLADALMVDDYKFRQTYDIGEVKKGGQVIVRIAK